MKRTLAIFLTLVILLSAFLCTPFSGVAEELTASSFTDGVVWTLSEGGAIDYLRLTNGWGSFTGANGSVTITDPNSCRSTMANIKGFTVGNTYDISFNATGITNVYAVLNYNSAYFNTDQYPKAKTGFESDFVSGTVLNGTATITVTPTSDNIYLIVKNNKGTVTLNNFKVNKVVEENSDNDIIAGINKGLTWTLSEGGKIDYLRLTNGWGSFVSSNGVVTITDPNSCRSTMANIKGFTAGATYEISFSASGISDVYAVLNYDSAYFNTDQYPKAKSGFESDFITGTVSNGIATIKVTTISDNIYLIVKNNKGTVKLSDFTVTEIVDVDVISNINNGLKWTLSDGGKIDYLRLTNGWGSFISSNGSVTITDPNSCRSTMANIKGFTANTTYEISFSASGISDVYAVLNYDSAYFNTDQYPKAKLGFESDLVKGAVSNGTAKITFTPTNDNIYLIVKNNKGTVTLSDFVVENPVIGEVSEPTSEDVAGGTWWSTRGATYTSSGTTVTWTSDPSWHSVYTELKGLEPNTKYEWSFEHNVADPNRLEAVWLYKGTKDSMTLNSTKDKPAEYTLCTVDKKSGKLIATFTTDEEESVYCIGMKVGDTNGLVLSNMTFGRWVQKPITADDIVNSQWTLGEGGKSTTDLVATSGWGKFYGVDGSVTITDPNSCRTSFTKVTGFVPGKDYELTFNAVGIERAEVVLADGSAYIEGVYQYLQAVSGMEENVVLATKDGSRYTVRFTAKNDYIYLTVKNKSGTVTLSDFIFDPLKVTVNTKWGGKVSISPSDVVAKNTKVTFSATPNMGNYFVGWYDGDALVSTDANYTVDVVSDISLNAVFDGKNHSSDDIFAQRGYDGTFENGTIPGWYATHYNAADANVIGFCNYTVSNRHAYEGSNSLRLQAYHRCSILPLTNLNENTDYRLSFYVLYEDNGIINNNTGRITANKILDSLSIHYVGANKVYSDVSLRYVKANSGWYKVDMYFNTEDATNLNYELYYASEDYATGCVYIDNMTLSEYYGSENVLNGDFSATVNNNGLNQPDDWMTYAEAATDNGNGVLKLDNEQRAYQIINAGVDSLYTVTFKAKGNLRAAAVDLAKDNADIKNLLSSNSYIDTNSPSWKEYSFKFYTNNHKAVKLMFEGLENGAMVDDIKISKAEISEGGIVENIDFETERFALSDSNSKNFKLYKKSSTKDTNVLSGNTSLKFTPSNGESDEKFIEKFMSYQTLKGVSYTLTFNYKATGSGEIYLTPDIYEKYGVEQGYTYSLGKGWKKTEFHFTALEVSALKIVMASISGSTKGDVYFDDISLKTRLPLIQAYNLENTYCDAIFNNIDYTGFEYFKNDGNMGKLPNGFNVVNSKNALSGSSIMTVTAGNKKIFAFNTVPNKIYEFAVSVKGNKNTSGSVAVTVDANGKYYYSDINNVARSIVKTSTNGKWQREAFSFITNSSGITYVVIECSNGTMEIDDMMLFESKYASLTDNNDYTNYEKYLANNPLVVIPNGGFNADGNFGDEYSNDSVGSLGDTRNVKFEIILLIASAFLLVLSVNFKKRKGEHNV